MILKNSIVAIALWTLLLAPLFCGLGVVVHACFDDHATECHHELECDADPCQILVLAKSLRSDELPCADQGPNLCEVPLIFSTSLLTHSEQFQRSLNDNDNLIELIEIPQSLPLLC